MTTPTNRTKSQIFRHDLYDSRGSHVLVGPNRPIELGHLASTGCLRKCCSSIVWLLPLGTAPTSDKTCVHCRERVHGSVTFCEQAWTPRFQNHNEYWHLRCIQVNSRLYAFIMEKAKEQSVLVQQIILESGKFRE